VNRSDTVIAATLSAGLVALLVPAARLGVDFHHDGIMLKPALDVLSGQVLFRDTFMQYGALTCYLQAAALWFQPTLLSIRLLNVAAYGVSLFFLYASWRLILPRMLTIVAAGLFVLSIPAAEPNFYDGWLLLPWSSTLAMIFQSIALYAVLRIIQSQQPERWGIVLGASCASVFWCRQPVGLTMFASLVGIGLALQWAKWTPVRGSKRIIFGKIAAGFIAVHALFLINIKVSGAQAEWWYQTFVWPKKWAGSFTWEAARNQRDLFELNFSAGLGLLLLLATIAAPNLARRFYPRFAERFTPAWWLCWAGVLLWQHESVLAWLHLRKGGWLIFIPLVVVLQAVRSLSQVFGQSGRTRPSEYYLVAAMAAIALASLAQYFPVPDAHHVSYSLAPGFGLFVFICWRWVGHSPAVLGLAFATMFLPAILLKARWAREILGRPLVTLTHPALLSGMRVSPQRARVIADMAIAVEKIMSFRPAIPSVMQGVDALPLCLMHNLINPSPYFIRWGGLTDGAEEGQRLDYILRARPLIFFQQGQWDKVGDFYRRHRYVPLLYIQETALEIAVPEEVAKAMGQSAYGLNPTKS